jgi:hypothetical protein
MTNELLTVSEMNRAAWVRPLVGSSATNVGSACAVVVLRAEADSLLPGGRHREAKANSSFETGKCTTAP